MISLGIMQKQAMGQVGLTGHGWMTPKLEHCNLSKPLEVKTLTQWQIYVPFCFFTCFLFFLSLPCSQFRRPFLY